MPLPDEFLGLSPDAFVEYLEGLEPQQQYPITWQGIARDIPVYLVDVRHPRYNHMNGRILPHVLEYCGNMGLTPTYFEENDPSSTENQHIFHEFISNDEDRRECFAAFSGGEIPVYTDPLICTPDGRIINGNQRLSTFRELFEGDPVAFEHLGHIWVAILPEGGAASDYRTLERRLQEGGVLGHKQFDWIQKGLNRRRDNLARESIESIANWAGETEDEIIKSITLIHIVDSYLEYLGTPGAYNTIRSQNHRQSILEIHTGTNRLQGLPNTDNERIINEFYERSFELMNNPEDVEHTGLGVYGHIRMLVPLLVNAAENIDPPQVVAENPLLNRHRQPAAEEVEIAEGEDIGPVIDFELEEEEENLAEAVRNMHALMVGRREADNQRTYANRQLTKTITSLENIIRRWGNYEVEGILEKIERIEPMLRHIRENLGDEG